MGMLIVGGLIFTVIFYDIFPDLLSWMIVVGGAILFAQIIVKILLKKY